MIVAVLCAPVVHLKETFSLTVKAPYLPYTKRVEYLKIDD